ncbi:MAG TPA: sensor histidine kinase, partial [Streptosporangiaceae bacterium]|nr:sensor histidine kinase [Streptosporangiaceae bacterium]
LVATAAAVAVADVFLAGAHHTLTLQTAGHVALVAVPVLAAEALRNRRSTIQLLRERLEQAERTREQDARRRAEQERLRIARELHDVVAHTMSTINVQASAAAMVLNERPEAAAEALAAIRSASRNGLRELRAILNVLRQADDADPTAPAPGLAQLDALVAGVTQAGLPTRLEISGDPAELPAGVDLAAYRIIQESLTNAIRHAGPATATVALAYLDDTLLIDVTDTGRGVPPTAARKAGPSQASSGHGLAGMRERAAAAGGTLQAGPAKTGPAKTSPAKTGPAKTSATGGFRVKAALPLRRPDGPGHRVAPEQAAAGQAAAEERARP